MPYTRTVLEVASNEPERVALTDGVRSITYGDLSRSSGAHKAVVDSLLGQLSPEALSGITFADEIGDIPVISISLTHVLDSAELVAVLAGYRTVTSVLDPLWPIEHRVRSIVRSGAQIVVTDDESLGHALVEGAWPGVIIGLDEYRARLARVSEAEHREQPPTVRDDEEPFLLIFTSGTTDLPKGFLRTRKSWRYNVRVSERWLRAKPAELTFAPGPLAYSLTLYALVEVLGTGGSIMLQSRFDPIDAARLLVEKPVTRLVAVPAVLPALAQAAKRDGVQFTRLTDAVIGGANLSLALRTSFEEVAPDATVLSYYGAAEIGFIAWSTEGDGALLEPFDGLSLSVRDENGAELPEGELGQLFVRVGSQGDRYISTTGGALITGADGWATVNDRARLVGGKLLLEGRAGDIAVTGGHKVSLVQIERTLEGVPGCERCCVVTQPHRLLGEILVAVIEATPGQPAPEKARVNAMLGELLPPQFVPHRYYLAEDFPRTVGGKIRRVEVRAELEAGAYTRL